MTDDILITNATVVTVDPSNRILRDAAIAIRGRRIVALGPTEIVSAEHPARKVIDARGMAALPGLVNSHIHVFTAMYKGTMCGLGFFKIAFEILAWFDDVTPAMMFAASRLAAVEMLRSGVTMANVGGDTVSFEIARQTTEALGQAGMKATVQTLISDIFGPTDLRAEAQVGEAELLLREYHGRFDGRIRVAPSPSAEAGVSLKTMRRLATLAQRENLIEHVHVFPRWPTGSFSRLVRGRSSVGLLRAAGLLNERLVAVHFLGARRRDIAALGEVGASVAHCPSVWMNLGVGPRRWLPLGALQRAGVNVVLGADSLGGFIEGADLFTEMRSCALMSDFLYGAGSLKPVDVLRMATINGARALGLEKETGSLEIGKHADIVLLRFDRAPLQPSSNVPEMLVHAASARDVDTVLVNGHVLVRKGRVLTVDENEAVTAARDARDELYRRGGWELTPDGATPPKMSLLERYPNRRVAAWGARLARWQSKWDLNRRGHRRAQNPDGEA